LVAAIAAPTADAAAAAPELEGASTAAAAVMPMGSATGGTAAMPLGWTDEAAVTSASGSAAGASAAAVISLVRGSAVGGYTTEVADAARAEPAPAVKLDAAPRPGFGPGIEIAAFEAPPAAAAPAAAAAAATRLDAIPLDEPFAAGRAARRA